MHPPVDSDLTDDDLEQLLSSDVLEHEAGLELLDFDLQLVDDISADLRPDGSSVSRSCRAQVHGACELQLARSLRWGAELVRPSLTLRSGQLEATWQLGAYLLTTPERPIGETPAVRKVTGYDRLALLTRQTSSDYTVTAGTTYYQALVDVFAAAGLSGYLIDSAALDYTLPADKTWPLVPLDTGDPDPDQAQQLVTWLRIVNDLLRAIGFRAVWCDDAGRFRCQQYQGPDDAGVEWTFSTSSPRTIVGDRRTLREDVWSAPNVYVFRNTNVAVPAEGAGLYTVDLRDGGVDWLGRELEWASNIDYDAASQATLEALGDQRVAGDRRRTAELDIVTGPFPGAGHFDVFQLDDPAGGLSRKVQATEWTMPLDGGDVEWLWEVVG